MEGEEMRRGSVDLGRVLASIAALVALVVVIPLGLIAVSRARFGSANPLAGVDLGWFGDDAASSLTRPIADDTVIDGLIRLSLCAAWAAIAVIVVTTVLEMVHLVRHRGLPTPSVRGLGWAQRIARFIALGLIVLIPLSTSSPSIATSLSGRATPNAVAESRVEARLAPTPNIATTTSTSMVTHVVQPGESVYSIAERLAAANGGSVIDIAESIVDANLDATVGPGQRFTTAAYIEAGWVLQIPAHLITAPDVRPTEVTRSVEADTYIVQRGDTLWDIADEQLGDPAAWPEIWEENAGDDMGGGRTFDDPDLILPGWELDLTGAETAAEVPADLVKGAPPEAPEVIVPPEIDAPLDVVVTEAEPIPSVTTPTTTASTVTESTTSATTAQPSSTSTSSTVAAGVGGADAAGVDQASAESPGAPSPLRMEHAALLAAGVAGTGRGPSPPTIARCHAAPPGARASAGGRRDRASIAGHRRRRAGTSCRCCLPRRCVVDHRDRVTDRVGRSDAGRRRRAASVGTGRSAAPWTGADHDWWLAADVPVELLSDDARQVGMPCVALVQLGVTAAGGDILIDVEACGTLAVEARRDQADEVITALAAGLASSMYAEVAHLIGVGLPRPVLLGHRNAHVADSTDAAVALARTLVGTTVDNVRTSFELRSLRTGGEMWEPAVILVGEGEVQLEADFPLGGHGIGLVAAAAPGELPDGADTARRIGRLVAPRRVRVDDRADARWPVERRPRRHRCGPCRRRHRAAVDRTRRRAMGR